MEMEPESPEEAVPGPPTLTARNVDSQVLPAIRTGHACALPMKECS